MNLTLKIEKQPRCPGFATELHRWTIDLQIQSGPEFRTLTGFIHRHKTDRASAVDDSTPGDPNLKDHAALAVVLPANGDLHLAARPVTSPVMDASFRSWPSCARQRLLFRSPATTYPLGRILRQPAPVSFSWKETGASNPAAALISLGFAANSLVTISETNVDVTNNSTADDGAADQGMDCT